MSGKCCCGGGGNRDADIKSEIKEKYGQVAVNAGRQNKTSCCGDKSCSDPITGNLYSDAEAAGVPVEALLASMGCANPTAIANLNPGETVLDLGSGGGIDVLLSAKRVGPTGKAYGLDMTDEMLALAHKNQKEAGVENVEFLKGEIENIPLPDSSVDVIISNCVINLSTDKDAVLREAFRVLKPGGRFAVADIVMLKPVTADIQKHLALWVGCIAGALLVDEYREKLAGAGFGKIEIEIARTYTKDDAEGIVPEDAAAEIGEIGIEELAESIASAFVKAVKP